MSTTTDLNTLKINYLTQAQYDAAVSGGTINENEIYMTPATIDYVTPEKYGAVGDGATDDTNAISQALSSGYTIVFSKSRTYRITQDITFHCSVDFNSSTLLLDGCSLIIDDGLNSQNHYGFGIVIENGFFIGDNTNTLINVYHSTKTTIQNCAFKNFLKGIYVHTGYEHNISGCRFIGSSSVHAVAIEKNDGDGFINDITGVDCYNAVVITKGKHLINNIHFWLNTSSLLSGSAMIVYSGAGQSNLTIDYAYIDSYEVGIRKSGLSTLNLLNSNIVMASSLLNGDYYIFDFADANQAFCVNVDNFSTPYSNESNFKICKTTNAAMIPATWNKMSSTIRNTVRYYNRDLLSWQNNVTADVKFTLERNIMHLKGTITVPSGFVTNSAGLTVTGAHFPPQSFTDVKGTNGNERIDFGSSSMTIANAAGQTLTVDIAVAYLPQY